jgi:hypothetical protein
VGDTSRFAASGPLTIDGREIAFYTGKTSGSFTGVLRGREGTPALVHAAGVIVEQRIISAYHNVMSAAIRAIEAKVGDGAYSRGADMYYRTGPDGKSYWAPLSELPTGFNVREVDTTPTVAGAPTIEFDQADGFQVTQQTGNVARIKLDLSTFQLMSQKNQPSGYAGLTAGAKLQFSQGQEVWSVIDLTDYQGTSGTGVTAIRATFTNLQVGDVAQWNGSNWVNSPAGGGSGSVGSGQSKRLPFYSGTGTVLDDAPGLEWDGAASPNFLVTAQNAAHVPLRVKLAASHTAAGFELRSSADALLTSITKDGFLKTADGGATTPAFGPLSDADTGFWFNNSQVAFFSVNGSPTVALSSAGFGIKNGSGLFWTAGEVHNTSVTTILDEAAPQVLRFGGQFAGGSYSAVATSPSQITSNQNNFNPGGVSYFQRWSTDASRTVTGLTFTVAQVSGQVHLIHNVGSNDLVLANESASSTAANRFLTSTGSDLIIGAKETAIAQYDATTQRWRVSKLGGGGGAGSGTVNSGADKKLAFYTGAGTTLDDAAGIEYQAGASPNVLITAQNAAHTPLTVNAAASPSADIQKWQINGTDATRLTKDGFLLLPAGSATNAAIGHVGQVNSGMWFAPGGATSRPVLVDQGSNAIDLDSANGNIRFKTDANLIFGGGVMSGGNDLGLNRVVPMVLGINGGNTSVGATFRTLPTTPSAITADQNNYNPGGTSLFQRWSSDALRSVTGLTFTVPQIDGQLHVLYNVGSSDLVLVDESASSTAANRFATATGANITLGQKEQAFAQYDAAISRWRVTKMGGVAVDYEEALSTKTAAYTITTADRTILANPSGGTFTLTISAASGFLAGGKTKPITIINIDATNDVTIDASGSETINGDLTVTLGPGEAVTLISNGSNWFIK